MQWECHFLSTCSKGLNLLCHNDHHPNPTTHHAMSSIKPHYTTPNNTSPWPWRIAFHLPSSPFSRTRSAHPLWNSAALKMRKVYPSKSPKPYHPCSLNSTHFHPRLTNGVPWHTPSRLLPWNLMVWSFHMCSSIFIMAKCFSLTLMWQAQPALCLTMSQDTIVGWPTSNSEYLRYLSFDLTLPTKAWTREAKDTSNTTTPLSTCSLLPLPRSPTSTR